METVFGLCNSLDGTFCTLLLYTISLGVLDCTRLMAKKKVYLRQVFDKDTALAVFFEAQGRAVPQNSPCLLSQQIKNLLVVHLKLGNFHAQCIRTVFDFLQQQSSMQRLQGITTASASYVGEHAAIGRNAYTCSCKTF